MLVCSYCWQPVGTGVERDRQFVGVSQTFSARILLVVAAETDSFTTYPLGPCGGCCQDGEHQLLPLNESLWEPLMWLPVTRSQAPAK